MPITSKLGNSCYLCNFDLAKETVSIDGKNTFQNKLKLTERAYEVSKRCLKRNFVRQEMVDGHNLCEINTFWVILCVVSSEFW